MVIELQAYGKQGKEPTPREIEEKVKHILIHSATPLINALPSLTFGKVLDVVNGTINSMSPLDIPPSQTGESTSSEVNPLPLSVTYGPSKANPRLMVGVVTKAGDNVIPVSPHLPFPRARG